MGLIYVGYLYRPHSKINTWAFGIAEPYIVSLHLRNTEVENSLSS